MTVVTPGSCASQASAATGAVRPTDAASAENSCAAATPRSKSTPENVSPTSNASPCRLYVRWSSAANTVSFVYLPLSSPEARGTRAMMATPASIAAGRTASSGLSRNALRMICTLATPGRAIAASAWSAVSTLTP